MNGTYYIDYSINVKSIESIPFDKYEKNFTFNVNGKCYKTNRFIADILSPIVRKMHYTDETYSEFSFYTNDKNPDNDNFESFLQLALFKSNQINHKQQQRYLEYFHALGNNDEFIRIQTQYSSVITIDNAVDILMNIIESTEKFKDIIIEISQIQELIDFIAKNFEDIDKSKLKNIKIDYLEIIIQNESLELENEDTLFKFILDLYREDHSYSILFESVLYSNVSNKLLKDFIDEFDFTDLRPSIWNSICIRLANSKTQNIMQKNKRYKKSNFIEFQHEEGNEFKGIIEYLTRENGGNIYDKGVIDITSNSIVDNVNFHPKNLIDYNVETYYCSNNNIKNSFICFDFKDRLVELESYTIKTYRNPANYEHLKNWIIEVSGNGFDWKTIDYHNNDNSLNGPYNISTFKVKKQNEGFYRYIRLKQTGESWCTAYGSYYVFAMICIEFYGKLLMPMTN